MKKIGQNHQKIKNKRTTMPPKSIIFPITGCQSYNLFFFASLNWFGYHCFFTGSSCYSGLLNGFFRAYRKIEDKLSNLPDNMIHKILFFLDTKYVVLSERRKNLRASVPDLSFDSKGFAELTFLKALSEMGVRLGLSTR